MKNTHRTIFQRVDANRLPCNVPYCTKQRFGAARFCREHARANQKYGHPHGRKLFPKDIALYRGQVAALLQERPEHPGAQAALAYLDAWMERAWRGENVPAREQMARLYDHGITAAHVLEAAAAVWVFSHKQPFGLPDDARRDFATALAVFHLAPRKLRRKYQGSTGAVTRRYEPIPRADRQAAGEAIRKNFGLLLHHIAVSLDERAADAATTEQELMRAFTAPFGHKLRITPTTKLTIKSQ